MRTNTKIETDIPCPMCQHETALLIREDSFVVGHYTSIMCERCGFGANHITNNGPDIEKSVLRELHGKYFAERQRQRRGNTVEETLLKILDKLNERDK